MRVALPDLKVEVRPDGRRFVPDPSPLKDMPPAQRLRRIKAMLELAALQGDVSAACELLRNYRWEREQRRKRDDQRAIAKVDSASSVTPEVARLLEEISQTPSDRAKQCNDEKNCGARGPAGESTDSDRMPR